MRTDQTNYPATLTHVMNMQGICMSTQMLVNHVMCDASKQDNAKCAGYIQMSMPWLQAMMQHKQNQHEQGSHQMC